MTFPPHCLLPSLFKAEVNSNRVGAQPPPDTTPSTCLLPQEDIAWLTQRTHYTSEEIQILYQGFLRDFPGNILKEKSKK